MGSVLVTGGSGYLALRLGRHLVDAGQQVTLASRGAPEALEKIVPGATGRTIDWEDESSIRSACEGHELLVHLAAPSEVVASTDPKAALAGTVGPTIDLLAAASQDSSCRRLLYLSTAHVYGSPLKGVLEEATPARPGHPYAIANRCAEDFVLDRHARGDLEGVILRLSNSMGAPLSPNTDRWKLVANDLCRQAVEARELRLHSDGHALRDFIPIADVCRAIEHLGGIEAPGDFPVFNVGSGKAISILEMAQLVASRSEAVLGHRPEIRCGDRADVVIDLEFRIAKLLATGFEFESSLEAEIDATLRACECWFG